MKPSETEAPDIPRPDRRCVCGGSGWVTINSDGNEMTCGGNRLSRGETLAVVCLCSYGEWVLSRYTRQPIPRKWDPAKDTIAGEQGPRDAESYEIEEPFAE